MKKVSVLFLFFLIVTFSCNDAEKIRKRDVLSEEDFYTVLKDIHIADAVISTGNLKHTYQKTDSASLYNYVLKKHDVSRQKFGNTVKYYSAQPGKYIEMYDSLISEFTQLEAEIRDKENANREIEEKINAARDSLNLWKMKKEWLLPRDGETNPVAFKFPLKKHGTYTLKAKIRVFKDDKSLNQRMTIIANYIDGTKNLNSAPISLKDNKFYDYEVSISTNKDKDLLNISGWLLDHSSKTAKKHVQVSDVELIYNDDSEENNKDNTEILPK